MDISGLFRYMVFIGLSLQVKEVESMATGTHGNCYPPNDCTQPPLKESLAPFPCVIGGHNECEAALSRYNTSSSVDIHSYVFLATIGVYLRTFDTYPTKSPAVTYSFTTPYGGPKSLETEVVVVDFDSPQGDGEDAHFKTQHICRSFDFSTAQRSDYDITNPREIEYKCLWGLALTNQITNYFYNLKFTSLPSHAVTPYLLVVPYLPRDPGCKVVMAVAAITGRRSIHVVWERPDSDYKIKSYILMLYKDNKLVETEELKYGIEMFEFKDLEAGYYRSKVTPQGLHRSTPCNWTELPPERAVKLFYMKPESGHQQTLNIVLAVSCGVVLAAVLLAFTYWVRSRIRGGENSRSALLVSMENMRAYMTTLSAVLTSGLDLRVHYEHENLKEVANTGRHLWLLEKAGEASVIIACIDSCHQHQNMIKDMISDLRMIAGKPKFMKKLRLVCFCNETNVFDHADHLELLNMPHQHKKNNIIIFELPENFEDLIRSFNHKVPVRASLMESYFVKDFFENMKDLKKQKEADVSGHVSASRTSVLTDTTSQINEEILNINIRPKSEKKMQLHKMKKPAPPSVLSWDTLPDIGAAETDSTLTLPSVAQELAPHTYQDSGIESGQGLELQDAKTGFSSIPETEEHDVFGRTRMLSYRMPMRTLTYEQNQLPLVHREVGYPSSNEEFSEDEGIGQSYSWHSRKDPGYRQPVRPMGQTFLQMKAQPLLKRLGSERSEEDNTQVELTPLLNGIETSKAVSPRGVSSPALRESTGTNSSDSDSVNFVPPKGFNDDNGSDIFRLDMDEEGTPQINPEFFFDKMSPGRTGLELDVTVKRKSN